METRFSMLMYNLLDDKQLNHLEVDTLIAMFDVATTEIFNSDERKRQFAEKYGTKVFDKVMDFATYL